MGVLAFAGRPSWGTLVAVLPPVLLGVYLLALAGRVCVILHADHLEVRGVFTRRRMYRRDIAARRLISQQHGHSALRLYSRNTGMFDLTLPAGLVTDADFDAWFEQPQPPTTTE